MTDCCDVFLSYSHNDLQAAASLRAQLRHGGLSVFKDDESIRAGDLWLDRLQAAIAACGSFVVLVGRDGVGRWIGAETQAALNRYFGPHDDAKRLPIFPILLGETGSETLPAFLRLFQTTPWNGIDLLPQQLLEQIRKRTIVANKAISFEGCPFVGLAAYRIDQTHLFFGRQKETLDALACFDTRPGRAIVCWLEINGNSGSGKSSLMQAGLLPLVDEGWLWPRTEIAQWRRIGPMMPGAHPVGMLAESLARAWKVEMADVSGRLQSDGDAALVHWLRSRKEDGAAFLLAIDQFEELFTFADPKERRRFDVQLAAALEDPDCPLFVISTVRADFLDRFGEDLPRLTEVLNCAGKRWTLSPISAEGLREVIEGPARLADLDVGSVQEAMVDQARDEPGALPLVENALHWLWQQRTDNRLSGKLFSDHGGLAGILSGSADSLLAGLGKQRDRALELLFQLVQVDPEGRRHTRRRIPLAEAIDIASGGERGRALVNRLAGHRRRDGAAAEGPLRLITITGEAGKDKVAKGEGSWVNLIHETLIRSKLDAAGNPQPYWPTLWSYIEKNKEQAARRERLQLMAREWKDRKGFSRLFGLAGWSSLFGFRGLVAPGTIEHRYLRWSRGRALAEAIAVAAILSVISESVYWARVKHDLPYQALEVRWAQMLGKTLPFPALVDVSPGAFIMGSKTRDNEQPVHQVTFREPFSIGATEVTFEQYNLFCEVTGRAKPNDAGWGRDNRPVIYVTWDDARAYARWLSAMTGRTCRLPSEAEWEYAARAGTTTEYGLPAPNGSDDIQGKGLANCADCDSQWSGKKTAPGGQFPANAWGLYDMHGNVGEWVEDCWHESYYGAPADGQAWLESNGGDCKLRVLRGGSWDVDRNVARSAVRNWYFPDDRYLSIGFRVVCSSPS